MFCRVLLTMAAVVLAGCSRENGVHTVTAAEKAAATSPVVSAEPAPDPEPRAAPPARTEETVQPAFLIPAGTRVRVRLAQTLDTKYSRPGSTFGATLADPIVVGNHVVVPRGTPFTGSILASKRSGRFRGRARLEITLRTFHMKGVTYHLATAPRHPGERVSQEAESGIDGRRDGGGCWNRRAGGGWNGCADRCGRGCGGGNDHGVFHGEKECDAAGGNADGVPDAHQHSGSAKLRRRICN